MAVITNVDNSAWSAAVENTNDLLVQCVEGEIVVATTAAAPAGATDGVVLTTLQALVIPAGGVMRYRARGSVGATVYYNEFESGPAT